MDSDLLSKSAEARRCTEAMRDLLLLIRARFEEEIQSQGVTLAQFRVLKAVEAQTGASAASIARECQVTPQTLHTMLTRAAREGWIVRGTTERNHRFVTAKLTPSGEAVLKEGRALQQRLEGEIWRGIPATTIHNARSILEAGLRNLRASSTLPDAPRHPRR